uniref:Uncharacterized protein n=1 Tax=Lotus japonicus TaxID=34305 RepID=I3SP74_LOTJA|nr:unknown [Lotus japonicus]
MQIGKLIWIFNFMHHRVRSICVPESVTYAFPACPLMHPTLEKIL